MGRLGLVYKIVGGVKRDQGQRIIIGDFQYGRIETKGRILRIAQAQADLFEIGIVNVIIDHRNVKRLGDHPDREGQKTVGGAVIVGGKGGDIGGGVVDGDRLAGGLIGGAIFVELVFNIPGLGNWGVDAILRSNIPVILAFVMVAALTVVLVNILLDLSYAWLNPKVRPE